MGLKIIYKNCSDLVPYENNARINDDAVEYVANSIREFGFKNPIIIDSANVIVAGHTRLKAAEKLGMTEVPCIIADDLTKEQIDAFRIADNSTAQIAQWDYDKLIKEMEHIDYDLSQFGLKEQMEEMERQLLEIDNSVEEDDSEIGSVNKRLLKCPMCGHINEEKAFKYDENSD